LWDFGFLNVDEENAQWVIQGLQKMRGAVTLRLEFGETGDNDEALMDAFVDLLGDTVFPGIESFGVHVPSFQERDDRYARVTRALCVRMPHLQEIRLDRDCGGVDWLQVFQLGKRVVRA
jgi:hypothetical protein